MLGRHIVAALILPGTALVLIPAGLLWWSGGPRFGWSIPATIVGGCSAAIGLALMGWTIRLFAAIGKGTLAPWDPTTRLVVHGPYRHVRNPMISGVLFVLLGETLLAGRWPLAAWLVLFALVNNVYLPLSEEPGLRKRFGNEYDRYAAAVPRWLPRWRAWEPE